MTLRHTLGTGLLVLLLGAPPVAAQELGISLLTSGQSLTDDGYFVLSDDDQSVAVDLGVSLQVWKDLAVFAEYGSGGETGVLFSQLDTDFALYAARLGLVYRYPLLPFLHPYALAGVGAYWGDIDLTAPSQTYDDTAVGVGAFAMGGLELIWYFGGPELAPDATFFQRLGIGVANDYGYTFGPTLAYDELLPENGRGQAVDMGEVDLSGFTWRLGITLRYRM